MRLAGALLLSALVLQGEAAAQDSSDLDRYRAGEQTRWISPENPSGAKGAGAVENRGAKGHTCFYLDRPAGVLPPI